MTASTATRWRIRAIYRGELAQGLGELGYRVEKTHADGRFEIEGVPREVIDAFSTRRAEIEAAMAERGMGESKDSPHLADRAALLTRAAKHDVDKAALRRTWQRQARALGFSASKVRSQARKAERGLPGPWCGSRPKAGRRSRASALPTAR